MVSTLLGGYPKTMIRLSYVAGLTALAIILKLRTFEIPYPPVPFLKYDISGVPLASIMLLSRSALLPAIAVYYSIHVALLGADSIGMAMKCLAELSTIVPLVLIYKKIRSKSRSSVFGVIVATVSRAVSMIAANLVVTPYWLLIADWAPDYATALNITYALIPHIALFNITIGLVVSGLSIAVFNVLEKTGLIK